MRQNDRDTAAILDVHMFPAMPSTAWLVSFSSHGKDSPRFAARRLVQLKQSGLVTGLTPPKSRRMRGHDPHLLLVETGLAAFCEDKGIPYDDMPKEMQDEGKAHAKRCTARVLAALEGVPGIGPALHSRERMGLSIIDAAHNQVNHLSLTAKIAVLLLYAARKAGIPVEYIAGDRDVQLSRAMQGKDVGCFPDAFLLLGGQAIAIEAETGTSTRKQLADKVRTYESLFHAAGNADAFREWVGGIIGCPVTRFSVVFYCADDRHAEDVEEEIRAAFPKGSERLLVVRESKYGITLETEELKANHPINGLRAFDWLKLAPFGKVATVLAEDGPQPTHILVGKPAPNAYKIPDAPPVRRVRARRQPAPVRIEPPQAALAE